MTEDAQTKRQADKRGWIHRLLSREEAEAEAKMRPGPTFDSGSPTRFTPDLGAHVPESPPELPPGSSGEPPIPAPGPDIVPPPGSPGPEMPPPGSPEPEMPAPTGPEPESPGRPAPDVIPPPEQPGPEMPPPGDPTPDIPADPELPHTRADDGASAEMAASPAVARSAEAEWIERRAREVRAQVAQEEAKVSWLGRLKRGLGRSSIKLTTGIGDLFNKRRLDDEALEELEELLITGDLGIETSARLTRALADARFGQEVTADEVRAALADEVAKVLEPVARTIAINDAYRPHVILVCGVNGSGKTTTIAKLAHLFKRVGFDVMLAAGDTFRAAAIEQLQIWGERAGCPVVAGAPGSDAASLAFDAYEDARARRAHVLLIDTAGRLHNKAHLMAELQKLCRVLKKLDERAPHDCILVLDATVGQNAHNQVEVFRQMVDVTGLAVTKLDGSAKGGVVVALAERFGLPVYAVGVGEGMDDMRAFEACAYARSLLGLDA
ncbi:MAG: signal recognition particle-docking protein FtsY [Bacteroidota bacterium]